MQPRWTVHSSRKGGSALLRSSFSDLPLPGSPETSRKRASDADDVPPKRSREDLGYRSAPTSPCESAVAPEELQIFQPRVYLFQRFEVEMTRGKQEFLLDRLAGLEDCRALLDREVFRPLKGGEWDRHRGVYEPSHFLHMQGKPGSGLRQLTVAMCRQHSINCVVIQPRVEWQRRMYVHLLHYAVSLKPCVVLLHRFDSHWGRDYDSKGGELFSEFMRSGISSQTPGTPAPCDEACLPVWFVLVTEVPLIHMHPFVGLALGASTAGVRPLDADEISSCMRRTATACLVGQGLPDESDDPDSRISRHLLTVLPMLDRVVQEHSRSPTAAPSVYVQLVTQAFRAAFQRKGTAEVALPEWADIHQACSLLPK